jgi:hypothetical protein
LAMAPSTAPEERVLVLVPVGRGAFGSLHDLGPGLEPAALQSQGAEHLPPRFDPVEVSGIGGLEDEFPARMEQAEQQHVRRAVSAEVVNHGIDPLDCGVDPGLDLAQDPKGSAAKSTQLVVVRRA